MEQRQSAWRRSAVKSATSWYHLFSELRCQHQAHGEQERRSKGCGGRMRLQSGEHLCLQELILFSTRLYTRTQESVLQGKRNTPEADPFFCLTTLLFCSVSDTFAFYLSFWPQILLRHAIAPLPHSRAFWWHMGGISLLSLPFLICLPTQSTSPSLLPTISWITGNSPHSASMTFSEFHWADSSSC